MSNNIKLIASDYDKTFHRNDEQDLKTNLNAVKEWRNQGHLFAISTGRDVASMLYEKKVRNIDYDYIISLNGSFIVDGDNNVLFKQSLDKRLARELVTMLKEKFADELIISNGFDGCNMTNKKASLNNEVAREVYQRNSKIYSKSIETALDGEVLLIGCLNDNLEKAKELQEEILLKYANEVEVFINLNYINIVPKGISKASGLDIIIKHAGADSDFVSVIGDDLNDIPMLEKYKGYAVNNAKAEVKAAALKVYNSVADLIAAVS